jgi:hypothetical protein
MAQMFAKHWIEKDKAAEQKSGAPGSMADKLRGALGNMAGSMGDVSHATDNLRQGQGAATGVANVMAARSARMRQQQNDKMLSAKNNMEMAAAQERLANEKEEHQDRVYSRYSDHLNEQVKKGYRVAAENISEQELAKRHTEKGPEGKSFDDLYEAVPARPITVNGIKVNQYSLLERQGREVAVSPTEAKVLGVPEGTKMTEPQLRSLRDDATTREHGEALLEDAVGHSLDSQQKNAMKDALLHNSVQHALSDPDFAGDRIGGLQQGLKDIAGHLQDFQGLLEGAKKSGDPAAVKEITGKIAQAQEEQKALQTVAAFGISDEDKKAFVKKTTDLNADVKEVQKKAIGAHGEEAAAMAASIKNKLDDPDSKLSADQKKALQSTYNGLSASATASQEWEKQKKLLDKETTTGFQGDPKATTPEAFMASLGSEEQSLVKEIGTGKMVIDRLGYLATRKPEILEAVAKAFPDFDSSKAAAYPKVYADFTSTKPNTAGGALNAGGTAMGHLAELRALNTPASHIPHTPAWTAYQNKADTLATELARFYGDTTIPAIAAIKDTLTSTLPGNREAAITTQAQSMGDKLESYENSWTNGAPSKSYEAPMPHISLAQKKAFASLNPKYAAEHPELGVKPQDEQKSPQPQGGQQKFKAGDTYVAPNGFTYKVTSVDQNGNVTGAE